MFRYMVVQIVVWELCSGFSLGFEPPTVSECRARLKQSSQAITRAQLNEAIQDAAQAEAKSLEQQAGEVGELAEQSAAVDPELLKKLDAVAGRVL